MRFLSTAALAVSVLSAVQAASISLPGGGTAGILAEPTPAEWAAQVAEEARAHANGLLETPGANGLFESLVLDSGLAVAAIPETATEGLEAALHRLAGASSLPDVPPGALDALPPEWRAALERLVGGLATAAELRNLALAGLTDADIAAVLEWSRSGVAAPPPAIERVDMPLLMAAGRHATKTLDESLPVLESLPASCGGLSILNTCLTGATSDCAFLPLPAVYLPPLLAIGDARDEGFAADVVLSVDQGGDDAYCNNAGSTLPSTVNPCAIIFAPVAVLVDLAGHDAYHSSWPAGGPGYGIGTDATASVTECWEGVGVLGIGVLWDRSGNDRYSSWKSLQSWGAACPVGPTATGTAPSLTAQGTQGFGGVGIGFLLDDAGQDDYLSHNLLCSEGEDSQFAATNFQGAGGFGVLRDQGAGDDDYASRNTLLDTRRLTGGASEFRAALGQGSGALVALLDGGGSDAYLSHNEVHDLDPLLTTGVRFNTFSVQATGDGAILHDKRGDNQLLSYNSLISRDSGGAPAGAAKMVLQISQAVAGIGYANLTLEDSKHDDLISWNWIEGETAEYNMEPAQAAGAGRAVLYSTASATNYLSHNHLESVLGSTMHIRVLQAVQAGSGWSVLVDYTREPEGDAYNSFNSLSSASSNTLRIQSMQALAPQTDTQGRAVLLDEDFVKPLGPYQDYFNSENTLTGGKGIPLGTIEISSGLGVLSGGLGPGGSLVTSDRLGYAWFENRGGSDEYNSGNVAGGVPPPCLFPNPATSECVDKVHAIAYTVPSIVASIHLFTGSPLPALPPPHAVFIDRETWPTGAGDAYQPYTTTGIFGEPAGGWGDGMLSTNDGFSLCEDHGDGAELPTFFGLGHGCPADT